MKVRSAAFPSRPRPRRSAMVMTKAPVGFRFVKTKCTVHKMNSKFQLLLFCRSPWFAVLHDDHENNQQQQEQQQQHPRQVLLPRLDGGAWRSPVGGGRTDAPAPRSETSRKGGTTRTERRSSLPSGGPSNGAPCDASLMVSRQRTV